LAAQLPRQPEWYYFSVCLIKRREERFRITKGAKKIDAVYRGAWVVSLPMPEWPCFGVEDRKAGWYGFFSAALNEPGVCGQ
jgi:hypothetical protein